MTASMLIIFSGIIVSALFILYFFFFERIGKGGKKFIIAGMFISFYIFLYEFILISGYINIAFWLYPFYYPLFLCFYPVIYHFLIYATNDKNDRLIAKLFTYIPVLALLIIIIAYLPSNYEEKIYFIKSDIYSFDNSSDSFIFYQIILYLLYYLQVVIFISLFIRLYSIHKERKNKSGDKDYLPNWIFSLISLLILYEFIYLLLILTDIYSSMKAFEAISNLLLVLLLGFLGIKYDTMIITMKLVKINLPQKQYSEQSNFDEEFSSKVMKDFNELIVSQQLYKNNGLKIEQVSKKLHLPVNKLSSVINRRTGKDFSNYINGLRVDEAKKMIEENKEKLKIEDIYLETGYYTRSTFNRAFKAHTGLTPTEYIKSISKSS